MGSRARHSSGRPAASLSARKGKRKTTRRRLAAQARPDFVAILGSISDSLSIIATAANALTGAEERTGTADAADVGDEIVTLQHGVTCLRRGYDALDVALREVRA
jgi:hypothetical protein